MTGQFTGPALEGSLGHGHDAVAGDKAIGSSVGQRDGGRARIEVGKGVLEAPLQ